MNLGEGLYLEFKMEQPPQNQTRQIAYKTSIGNILEGEYVKEEGWIPNYILSGDKKLSRVNLVGVIIAKSDNLENEEFLLEDKSGNISVRFFEKSDLFEKLIIGDFVLIIGRPREYNGQKYVVPEIIKQVKKEWFELRMLEIGGIVKIQKEGRKKELLQESSVGKVSEEEIKVDVKKENVLIENIIKSKINSEDVIGFIKKLDVGKGADYEEVLEKAKNEKIITALLEDGEIFEIKPGKLKVL